MAPPLNNIFIYCIQFYSFCQKQLQGVITFSTAKRYAVQRILLNKEKEVAQKEWTEVYFEEGMFDRYRVVWGKEY
jgi:hypothetical protein